MAVRNASFPNSRIRKDGPLEIGKPGKILQVGRRGVRGKKRGEGFGRGMRDAS